MAEVLVKGKISEKSIQDSLRALGLKVDCGSPEATVIVERDSRGVISVRCEEEVA